MSAPSPTRPMPPFVGVAPQPDRAALTLAETGLDDATRDSVPTIRYVLAGLSIVLLSFIPIAIVVMPETDIGLLQTAFHTDQLSWAQTSASIAGTMLALPLGRLGDLYGKKLVLGLLGIVTVTGSVICAMTHSFALFLVGRALEGAGLVVMVLVYGLIRDVFPRRWIPYAISLTAAGYGVWRPFTSLMCTWAANGHTYAALFWLLAIISAAAISVAVIAFPETPLRTRMKLDWHGLGLIAVGLFAVTYGLNETSVPGRGWSSPWTIGFLIVGVALCASWYSYERSSEFAGTGGALLQDRRVIRPLLVMLLASMLFLTVEVGFDTLMMTPAHLGAGASTLNVGYGLGLTQGRVTTDTFFYEPTLIVAAIATAVYSRRRGPRLPAVLGILLIGAGLLVLAFTTTQLAGVSLGFILYDIGTGSLLTGLPILIIEAIPAHDQGIGGGLFIIMQNAGATISTQFIGAVTAHHVLLATPTGATISTHAGIQLVMWLGAGIAICGTAAALWIPHGRVGASGGALPNAASAMQAAGAPVR